MDPARQAVDVRTRSLALLCWTLLAVGLVWVLFERWTHPVYLGDHLPPADRAHLDAWRIDPNTASLAEWSALPGVGQSLAGRIIAYRFERGGADERGGPGATVFRSLRDLDAVKGIGPALIRRIEIHLVFPINSREAEGG